MAAVFTAQPSPPGNIPDAPIAASYSEDAPPPDVVFVGPSPNCIPSSGAVICGALARRLRQTSWRSVISPSPCHPRRLYGPSDMSNLGVARKKF